MGMGKNLGFGVFAAMMTACGGASSEAATTPATATQTTATESAQTSPVNTSGIRRREESEFPTPPAPWEQMDGPARGRYMSQAIVPYFRELFVEYDAERYADFGCQTCHGASGAAQGFAMPNPDLLALHPSGSPEQQQMVQEHPRMVRFMFNHVVPPMRTALGMPEYDAETGEGFSCYTCHPAAE